MNRRYLRSPSDHFDGQKYYNLYGGPERNFWDVLYWFWVRNPSKWPDHVDVTPQKIKHERVGQEELWVTFINHSTVLIQIDGWNILTDPIWSERASPFSWIGPKRVALPGVRFEDLPPIDLVLISHNHYDHMDIPTLRKLQKEYHPQFFTGLGNKSYLETKGLTKVHELDWWDSIVLADTLTLFFVPAQHFSARTLWNRNKTLWGGFVIKGSTHTVYFAGDTGYGPHFKDILSRIGPPTLSLLPIGAFKPEWFMKPVHLAIGDMIQAYRDLNSKKAMAIHFGTFQLSDEEYDEATKELGKALEEQQLSSDKFWILQPGEGRQVE